jgi:hypothetical protein
MKLELSYNPREIEALIREAVTAHFPDSTVKTVTFIVGPTYDAMDRRSGYGLHGMKVEIDEVK